MIGDLQGNLTDLFVLEKHYFISFPVIPHNLVFLGNYSGACQFGIEVIAYLFSLKLCAPNKIILLRGASETKSVNKMSLLAECCLKYGPDYGMKVYDTVNLVFERLPFATIIDESIFCAHSGVPRSSKIFQLNTLNKDVTSVMKEAPFAYEV